MTSEERAEMEAVVEGMLQSLAESGENMAGFDLERLQAAMAEDGALESVLEMLPREQTSVQQGEEARDFTLPVLAKHPSLEGDTVTLSTHFGHRPVGLIFGSFT